MAKALLLAEPEAPHVVTIRHLDMPRNLLYLVHTDTDLLLWWLGPHALASTDDCHGERDGGEHAPR